jgi:hypothetical protein
VTRRSPRWAVESVAWCASLVLLAGVGVAVSGVIGTSPAAVADDTPILKAPAAVTATVPRRPAVKTPTSKPTVVARARTGVPVETSLGPPPGPQNDRVPTTFAAPADRYALLLGVTDYPSPTHDTIGAANDVRFIRQSLLAAGWLPQNIRIYTDRQVTGAVTRAGLSWLAGKSVPGTFTLFHYSGHVKQAGGHEKLWPADRDFVLDTELAAILNRGQGKMWVDIAGCEAGGFIEDLPSARTLVTSSSLASQKSYEYPQWGESVWTGLVWDLGLGQGQADANRNGTTTIGESLRYAAYYAQAITLHQRPYGRQTPQVEGDPVRGWTLDNPPA